MYTRFQKLCFTLLIISALIPFPVQAASGLPGTQDFGYGGRVNLWGDNPQGAVLVAGNFNLDWIAVDFNWTRQQPVSWIPPNWSKLDQAIQSAATEDLGVMISITQAPNWAIGKDGPDPQKTAELIATLARRYPEVLMALELFPFANTVQGWGTQPDPQAYASLLKTATQAAQLINPEITLVAAGLTPATSAAQDMEDIVFLKELYQAEIADFMPIIGLRLPPLGNNPLATTHETENIVLRHYEEINTVMIENGHKNGLIWITGFSWDANLLKNPSEQAAWLKQAYLLFRSQLYIGAAFFDGLNPSSENSTGLLFQNGQKHPGFEELIQVIAQDNNSQTIEISLDKFKKLVRKNHLKGN